MTDLITNYLITAGVLKFEFQGRHYKTLTDALKALNTVISPLSVKFDAKKDCYFFSSPIFSSPRHLNGVELDNYDVNKGWDSLLDTAFEYYTMYWRKKYDELKQFVYKQFDDNLANNMIYSSEENAYDTEESIDKDTNMPNHIWYEAAFSCLDHYRDSGKIESGVTATLVEAMAKAIRLDEIPDDYRKLPILGRGVTSIVFALDADTVIMFTRDPMKVEWLTSSWGLDLGQHVHEIKGYNVKIHKLRDFDIHAISMPRMFPLSPEQRRVVKKEIDQLQVYTHKFHNELRYDKNYRSDKARNEEVHRRLLSEYQENHEDSILLPFLEFLTMYEGNQGLIDLHLGNVMSDAHSNIVVVDPVISKEILEYSHARSQEIIGRREEIQRYRQKWGR